MPDVPLPGVRVLLADDDARVRRTTAANLSRIGLHLITADNGVAAIALAEATAPDVALVDYDMPTGGVEILKRLKALYGPAVWVTVLTGREELEIRAQCFAAGADDVITKPISIAELRHRVLAAARTQKTFVETRIARERADRLLAYGAEASAMLAHDLNNGLAAALANVSYLETSSLLDDEARQALGSTTRVLRRMSGLVANLVDIARFEDAAVKPVLDRVTIRPLLIELVDVHAGTDRLRFRIECDPGMVGWFDRALIERVLHNLVGNAARYCRARGEILLTARTPDSQSANEEPDEIEITVSNTGPQIPAEIAPKLFGKYAHGPDGRRGVGLYFCRLACEAHGGRIGYRPLEDGPMFFLRLPGRG
jgi:signal transduction histidine kinase